jgi:hypothetical protein
MESCFDLSYLAAASCCAALLCVDRRRQLAQDSSTSAPTGLASLSSVHAADKADLLHHMPDGRSPAVLFTELKDLRKNAMPTQRDFRERLTAALNIAWPAGAGDHARPAVADGRSRK